MAAYVQEKAVSIITLHQMERCAVGTLKRKKVDYKKIGKWGHCKEVSNEIRMACTWKLMKPKMNAFLWQNHICFIYQNCIRVTECIFTSLDFPGIDITNLTGWLFLNTAGWIKFFMIQNFYHWVFMRLLFLFQDLMLSTCILWLGSYKTQNRFLTVMNEKSMSCFTTNTFTKYLLSALSP